MTTAFWWNVTILALTWMIASSAADLPTSSELLEPKACNNKQTCHECIQTPSCAWCSDPDFQGKRCLHLPYFEDGSTTGCSVNYILNPDSEYIKIRHQELTQDRYRHVIGLAETNTAAEVEENKSSSTLQNTVGSKSFETSSDNGEQETVQLYPQEISLKLRINEVQKIKIQYASAEEYPLDIYYIIDFRNSMKDIKHKLSDPVIVEALSNITSDFRLGFGSFVDKVAAPYINVAPKVLREPCVGCASPYGFKNHMPLSNNIQQFVSHVRNAPVSADLDSPGGGFDALMQAIVCNEEIGWREKALKVIIFATDASFHYAGDGKLGGIVKPNDGHCHLDKNGLYTHSTLQDYPSISQINLKVKDNAINIIWAVTEEQIRIYNNLTKVIEGSYAAKLSDDLSNIVYLVRDQYNAISSSIQMKDNASNYVNLTYYSSCLGDGPLVKTDKCDGLKVGDKIEFTVEVGVPACPKNRSDWNRTFMIKPVGIYESLTVNLEMICDCACERGGTGNLDNFFEAKSEKCNYQGDLSCGICSCYDGNFGDKCECRANDQSKIAVDEFACRMDNTSTLDCSGRGNCVCNMCTCYERENPEEMIYGKFCECDNFTCERYKDQLCSGRDHGQCVCGQCMCNKDWVGPACECSTDTSKCFVDGIECSGHGKCYCGKCYCFNNGGTVYTGELCDVIA